MDHYYDIRLLPDPEFVPTLLMNALFGKLHRALVELDSRSIGVSFPDTLPERPTLGERLRLHGSVRDLDGLMARGWLTGMRDHIDVGDMTAVPDYARHRIVRRVQAKSNPERLRRRTIRRRGVSEEEARRLVPDSAAERLNLPFVSLRSQSTGQTFRLFVEHRPLQAEPVPGEFSSYGLSSVATVPWF